MIDANDLIEGRVCNDPVVIAAKCAPTVDAVEVVRCKDCKYATKYQPIVIEGEYGCNRAHGLYFHLEMISVPTEKGEAMSDKEITKIIPADERCVFCKKREATLLCDVPVMKITHHAKGAGFSSHTITCDKKLCENCATRVYGFDYCPDCIQKIKTARKGIWDIRGEER